MNHLLPRLSTTQPAFLNSSSRSCRHFLHHLFSLTVIFSCLPQWSSWLPLYFLLYTYGDLKKKTKQKKVECIRKLDNCYVEVITDTKLDSYQLRFAYFEKNCRKKCTQQSRKYRGWFWVNWSSKKIERMTREAIDACLRVLKESKKVGSTATVSGTVYWWDSMLPSGLTHAHFFWLPFSK